MKTSELKALIKEEILSLSENDMFLKSKLDITNSLNDDFFKALDYFSGYYAKDDLGKRFKGLKTSMLNLKNDLNKFQKKR
jgi:hypothetical protein